MTALLDDVQLALKRFLGPAAPAFLARELTRLGIEANALTNAHVLLLAQHAKGSAARLMTADRADELGAALLACVNEAATSAVDERVTRIRMLCDAVRLAPADLTAHRRLAATLANSGDTAAAAAEYARFVDVVLASGDSRRALLELTYARETLGERPEILELVDRCAPRPAPVPVQAVAEPPVAIAPEPIAVTVEPDLELDVADWRAMALIGTRHPNATPATLGTARRLLAEHKLAAASDLLLDYIASGYTDREAQRLLIEVDCGIGKRELAKEKCRLLGAAFRLDGRVDAASDVERFATMI